jgi:hypothetical protein
MLGRLDNLLMMTCPCGVGIKVPPGCTWDTIPCPRCGRENPIPKAAPRPASPGSAQPPAIQYRRTGQGWESFKCECGYAIQLSPMFDQPTIRCNGCGRAIEIVGDGH